MAYKHYIPQLKEGIWADYWNQTSIENDLLNCPTDELLPILKDYLSKPDPILEAGCGLGKWVIYLSRLGYNITGIDSYPEAIKTLKSFDSKLKVAVDKVEDLSLKDNSISGYLSFGVVEHFEEGPQKPLREAYRVLKPGGIAVIETPLDNTFRKLIRSKNHLLASLKLPLKLLVESLGLRKPRPQNPMMFYEYHYQRNELENYVSQSGFKLLKTYPKDDFAPNRSIGLWLDFPSLRQKGSNFVLNSWGKLVKQLFSPFPYLWSACVVVVAQKE